MSGTETPDQQFARVAARVDEHFSDLRRDAESTQISMSGERYVTIRASNLAFGFHRVVHDIYGDAGEATRVCNGLLYDLARAMGQEDARLACDQFGLTEPLEKLAAGPAYFANTGMAAVNIDPASRPVASEEFQLEYEHLESFEADSWLAADREAPYPVCIMGCGYSSGWCSVAFDQPLSAVEYTCRARGDDACRFIMAHSAHIESRMVERVGEEAAFRLYVPQYFARKDDEASLRAMALKDSLTDLANRPALHSKIAEAIGAANRSQAQVCLLFIDLDGFKGINDTHGHDAGDEALKITARRLEAAVRSTDVVARLGGDEFAALLPNVASIDAAAGVAAKLVESISETFEYQGHTLSVGASIGVGAYLNDGSDADALIADADAAMYAAKKAGKYQYKLSANAQKRGS